MSNGFSEVIFQMSVMAIIVAVGYLAKKIKIFNESSDKSLSALIINITCPALILVNLTEPKDYSALNNLPVYIVLSVFAIVFTYFLSKQYLKLFKYSDSDRTIFRFGMIFGNTASLGFPLCYGLLGNTGLLYATLYSSVQEAFLWSVGINIMVDKGKSFKSRIKNLLNPNMIAVLAGTVMFATNVKLPGFLQSTLSSIGSINMPLALMIVGSSFYNTKIGISDLKKLFMPALYKLLLIPAVLGLVLYFIDIEPVLKTVLLLQISMPFAATGVTLARNYEKDSAMASKAVTITTGLCLVTLPIITYFAEVLF